MKVLILTDCIHFKAINAENDIPDANPGIENRAIDATRKRRKGAEYNSGGQSSAITAYDGHHQKPGQAHCLRSYGAHMGNPTWRIETQP